jgi:DNA-binding beta-propeller fold protein YncE
MRVPLVSALVLAMSFVSCGDAPQRLNRPTNTAFVRDEVWVADGYGNARVVRFGRDGRYRGEFGERGFGPGQFNTPHGIVADRAGRVYVADRENARIQVFDGQGVFLAQWKSDALGRPWAVAVGPDGSVYAVDGGDQDPERPRSRIVRLDAEGRVVAQASRFGRGPGELDWGHGIAVDGAGAVYVVDVQGRRVQKFAVLP